MKEVVVGVNVVALCLNRCQKFGEGGVVFVRNQIGFGNDSRAIFEVDEAMGPLEVEFNFLWIEEVEDGDIMLAEAKVLEGSRQFVGIREEV